MYCYEIFIFRCGEKRFAGSADSNSITEFFPVIIVALKAIITIGTHNGVWWWNTINRIEITKQIFERSPFKNMENSLQKHRTQLPLRFKKLIHTWNTNWKQMIGYYLSLYWTRSSPTLCRKKNLKMIYDGGILGFRNRMVFWLLGRHWAFIF